MGNVNSVLKEVLERVRPTEKEIKEIKKRVNEIIKNINLKIKKLKIDAEVFVGGSFAKNTIIKKDHYDIDIFLRFDKRYKDEEISDMANKILEKNNPVRLHGSRDYFRIKDSNDLFFEIVPVMKIKNPREAMNVTDLSYSHVRYINKKIKKNRIADEIRVAKAFCYANKVYGAESYIRGFSGYALELLVYYYKGFIKFLKAMARLNEKIVIDIEKAYKNKNEVLMNINSSKLQSLIILIDPTYKERNVLAALSNETFEKFKKTCINFLKRPSMNYFEIKEIDIEKIKNKAVKNKNDFMLIEIETDKQEGDIAGSKLLKFYRHLGDEFSKYFKIKEKGFIYDNGKTAKYYFVAKNKGEIIFAGPMVNDKENVLRFKKKHENIFIKKDKIYAREKVNFDLKEFISSWIKKNENKMREMGIVGLRFVD